MRLPIKRLKREAIFIREIAGAVQLIDDAVQAGAFSGDVAGRGEEDAEFGHFKVKSVQKISNG